MRVCWESKNVELQFSVNQIELQKIIVKISKKVFFFWFVTNKILYIKFQFHEIFYFLIFHFETYNYIDLIYLFRSNKFYTILCNFHKMLLFLLHVKEKGETTVLISTKINLHILGKGILFVRLVDYFSRISTKERIH